MRIYNEIIINIRSGRVTRRVQANYTGPVALLKGADKKAPPPPEPPPVDDSAEVEAAALEARRLARRRAGRSSTILTSGLGVSGTTGQRKKLFGA